MDPEAAVVVPPQIRDTLAVAEQRVRAMPERTEPHQILDVMLQAAAVAVPEVQVQQVPVKEVETVVPE